MIFAPIIAALVLALVITVVFALLFKNNGPWGVGFFFLILFLVLWAGGLWLNPIGPFYWGISWAPLIFIGLVVALLLSAANEDANKPDKKSSSNPPNPRDGEERNVVTVSEDQHKDAIAISVFFWAVLIVLILAIIAGYLFN